VLELLEYFYFRYNLVGVTWATPSSKITLGRPATVDCSPNALVQYQTDASSVTAFVSDFGRGRYLVVMYPFGDPMMSAPRSFMLLATAIQRGERGPDDLDLAAVRNPRPQPLQSRGAEADA
jgi:hypothetical protein